MIFDADAVQDHAFAARYLVPGYSPTFRHGVSRRLMTDHRRSLAIAGWRLTIEVAATARRIRSH